MKKTPSLFVLLALAFGCQAAQETQAPPPSTTAVATSAAAVKTAEEDPYLWLEDVTAERSLDWVKSQNALSTKELEASPNFEPIRARILSILNSKEKIPFVSKMGKYCYNFWRDEKAIRGLWRRTTLEDYKKPTPNWETVLDIDALAKAENENWIYKGNAALYPNYDRCLIFLSRGGADATVVREFDLNTKEFLADGFTLPEAKSQIAWRDRDSVYVGTDFGPGSLTNSGYPRIVKEWKRGTPLSEAKTIFEGKTEDVSVGAGVDHDHGVTYEFVHRGPTFFTNEIFFRSGDELVKVDKPDDAGLDTFGDQILITLRTDWTVAGKTYPAGALLATDFKDYMKGKRNFTTLFEPTDRKSLSGTSSTKNYLIVHELDNVRSRVYLLKREKGEWKRLPFDTAGFESVGVGGIDPDESDDYFMTASDFLTPSTLFFGSIGTQDKEKLKSLPAYFNPAGLEITQHETTSKDGTKIPYFQVSRKNLKLDGNNPTLLYGYGGFKVSMLPSYSGSIGFAWLERGGVYILSNIRGGGEFGPKWHEAGRKENRQRIYDDFIAIAEDLNKRKVTSPKHLGIMGGSNGGLLMGVMLTERPDLWKAVVCQVPLLDMKRFNKLLAGASWMDEYGNPDTDDWSYIQKYSPYQNVKKETHYPRVLFTTSTRDDRVHPGHARKMVARMKEQGHDVLYYENIEGGHGGAANNQQSAYMAALSYSFLIQELWPTAENQSGSN